MHRLLIILFAVIILHSTFFIPNCLAETTWQSIGPYGGNASVTIDPHDYQILYAMTNSGIFKSINGGASWNIFATGFYYDDRLVFDPTDHNTLYIVGSSSIKKSTNSGTNWNVISNAITSSIYGRTFVIDPVKPQTLYVATGNGIFKSIDGGASWNATNTLSDKYFHSLVIDPTSPQTLYAVTYTTTTYSAFKSTNGGASWSAFGNGIIGTNISYIAIDPVTPQTLYVGSGGNIFKSTNGGSSWLPADVGVAGHVASLYIAASNPQILYAYTDNDTGFAKSINGGSSWSNISGLPSKTINSLVIDPTNPQVVYTGSYDTNNASPGIFKSTDGGTTWKLASNGLKNLGINTIVIDPKNTQTFYTGTWGGGVFKTTDGGVSWNTANTGLPNLRIRSMVINPLNSVLYAGTDGGIYKSTDGGTNWSAASTKYLSGFLNLLAIDPSNPQTLYVGGIFHGIYKSTDGGANWSDVNNGLNCSDSIFISVYFLTIDPITPQTLYVSAGCGVFKSTNGGASWTAASSGMTYVNALAIDPFVPQTLYVGSVGSVFKSTDGGTTWNTSNTGLNGSSIYSLAIDPINPLTVYAGAHYNDGTGGIFKSINGGLSWSLVSSGLIGNTIGTITIDPISSQTVYAGTGGSGIFKLTSSNAPAITSSTTSTFISGTTSTYTVATDGAPKPTISMSGTLPIGITFDSTTGILSGTPATGTTGTYNLMFTATNGVPPDATRGVTLTVLPSVPLTVTIATPSTGSKTATLKNITGTATGAELAKVEVQITDGIYYLQSNGSFSTTPAWIAATGTSTWTLDTGTVTWVDGITYTVFARASDGTNQTAPVKSNFKILTASSKAGTALSIDFTPAILKSGDSTISSGKIMRLPDDGSSLAGLTVNMIVSPPSTAANPTPAPIIIPMTTTSTGSYTSGTLSQFTTPGVYITQARFDGSSTLAAYSTVPAPLYVNIQSGYAIVITGKATDNSLLDQHTATTDTIIATLKKRGFLDTNINYLKSTASASVTKQQIKDAITVWARDKIAAAPAPLYIIMIDHGTSDGFVLDSARLTSDDMKAYLDTLEADPAVVASSSLANFNRFIIIGSCYSGTFIPKLSKPGRIIITSAASDEESLAGVNVFGINSGALYGGEYFVDTLFAFLGRGDTFKDAFTKAAGSVSIRDPRIRPPSSLHYGSYDMLAQHPLLDDNGDTKPSYLLGSTDGMVTASLTLGEGIRVNALSNPADIASVAPAASLSPSTSSKQLWLKANTNARVARAWAEIRRPGSLTTGGGSGQVIPTLDMIPLIYDGSGWIGDYSKFDTVGTYDIYYYTKDSQTDDISPTVTAKVYKQTASNTAPTAFSLISPDNKGTPPPMFPLSWQESTDTDGLTYTLLVATDQNFNTIVYREENIPQNATYMPKDTLKDPASATGGYYCSNGDSYCYWKIIAIDSYGATTESNTRSFTITSTNGLPALLKGYVRNSTSGIPIAGAKINTGTATTSTLSNGSYLMTVPTGTINLTITATGYQTKNLNNLAATAGVVLSNDIGLSSAVSSKPGDCDNSGTVTIAEVQSAINMFLGLKSVDVCVDLDSSNSVSIAEVQKVINSFLGL